VLVIAHVLMSAHHRSDGIVISVLAATAAVVVAVALVGLLPPIRTQELT
jgi:hypothetical protein